MLESLDFEYSDDSSENNWWAILGGTKQLALRMKESLAKKLSRVTAIRVGKVADMEIDIQTPSCGWDTAPETESTMAFSIPQRSVA